LNSRPGAQAPGRAHGQGRAVLDQASNANQFIDKFRVRPNRIIAERIEALEPGESPRPGRGPVEALEQRLARATRDLEQRIEAVRGDAEGVVGPTLTSLTRRWPRRHAFRRSPTMHRTAGRQGLAADLVRRAESVRESADGAVRHSRLFRLVRRLACYVRQSLEETLLLITVWTPSGRRW